MEALSLRTPVLASARSPVLLDHCRRSNAGLFYASADEFVEALALLVGEPELRRSLGANGRLYVETDYAWPVVLERYRSLIRAVQALPR